MLNIFYFILDSDLVMVMEYVFNEQVRYVLVRYLFQLILVDEIGLGIFQFLENIFEGFYLIYKRLCERILFKIKLGFVIIFFKE